MKRTLSAALALTVPLIMPLGAQAGVPGLTVKVGAYQWWQDWDGDVRSGSTGHRIDANRDLGIDDDNGATFYAAFEHFVPVLPNLKVQRSNVEISARNRLEREIEFEGQTYNANTTVATDIDLSHTDGTVYWRLLDNVVGLHLGLTARHFDGEIKLTDTDGGQSGDIDLDTVIPLIYGAAHVKLPLTGLYANAEINAISVRDSSATDFRAGLGYGYGPLNIEGGYRYFDLDYDDDDERANLTVDGFYLGARLEF